MATSVNEGTYATVRGGAARGGRDMKSGRCARARQEVVDRTEGSGTRSTVRSAVQARQRHNRAIGRLVCFRSTATAWRGRCHTPGYAVRDKKPNSLRSIAFWPAEFKRP